MQTEKNEIRVGIFLLAALLVALFAYLKVTNVTSVRTEPIYALYTTFDNTGGLKARSPVSTGGVVVGRVADTTLDPKIYSLHAALEIGQRYNHILDISLLSIHTSGLLGEQYPVLNVGFKDPELGAATLKDGDTIQDAKSAMVLEDLAGQFLHGSKGDDNKNSGDAPAVASGNSETAEPVGITR